MPRRRARALTKQARTPATTRGGPVRCATARPLRRQRNRRFDSSLSTPAFIPGGRRFFRTRLNMAISAADVKKLRDQTGAGMMDCKTALEEAQGDFDEATTILRKKGLASAAKKAGRAMSEGLIGNRVAADHTS